MLRVPGAYGAILIAVGRGLKSQRKLRMIIPQHGPDRSQGLADRMVDIEKSLAEFSNAAQRLNEKSNSINELIGQVEKRLAAAQAGIEFAPGWQLGECEAGFEQELEYGETGDRWQFLVRLYRRFRVDDWGKLVELDEEERILDKTTPLLQASRGLRIEALRELPAFVDSYRVRLDELVATIDRAEESLK